MIPIPFLEMNRTFTEPKNWSEAESCLDLPAYDNGKQLISCWKGTWKDRIRYLFTGKIWLWVWARQPPPVSLDTRLPFIRKHNDGS